MRRTERLFAIAEYLRGRRTGVTAEELAERFGVAVRTIYRDLDALRDARMPLQSERGRGGGYALDRAYSLPPVNFTAREAALLVALGQWIAETRAVPFTDTLRGGLEKVRAALPAQGQREVERIASALVFVGAPALSAPEAARAAIERGWFEARPVRIRYRDKAGAVTQRTVRVESVRMDRGEVALVCTDLELGERREFKLHRVEAASVVQREPREPRGQRERAVERRAPGGRAPSGVGRHVERDHPQG